MLDIPSVRQGWSFCVEADMTLVFGICLAHSEGLGSQMGTPWEEDIHVRYSLWALVQVDLPPPSREALRSFWEGVGMAWSLLAPLGAAL